MVAGGTVKVWERTGPGLGGFTSGQVSSLTLAGMGVQQAAGESDVSLEELTLRQEWTGRAVTEAD